MFSTDVIAAPVELDEAPWADLRGKPLDTRQLARYLRPYGVSPKQVRVAESSRKGYAREDLHDPWSRYLGEAPLESETSETSVTGSTFREDDSDAYRSMTRGE